jgi:hypothetical protein
VEGGQLLTKRRRIVAETSFADLITPENIPEKTPPRLP